MTHPILVLALVSVVAAGCGSQGKNLPECDSSQSDEALAAADAPGASATHCLSRAPSVDASGQVSCLVLELRTLGGGESCACDAARGRAPITEEHRAAEDIAAARGITWTCSCEVTQLVGAPSDTCRDDPTSPSLDSMGDPINGFCYIDAAAQPPVGAPEIVSQCPDAKGRALRFVGDPAVAPGATLLMVCAEEKCGAP